MKDAKINKRNKYIPHLNRNQIFKPAAFKSLGGMGQGGGGSDQEDLGNLGQKPGEGGEGGPPIHSTEDLLRDPAGKCHLLCGPVGENGGGGG